MLALQLLLCSTWYWAPDVIALLLLLRSNYIKLLSSHYCVPVIITLQLLMRPTFTALQLLQRFKLLMRSTYCWTSKITALQLLLRSGYYVHQRFIYWCTQAHIMLHLMLRSTCFYIQSYFALHLLMIRFCFCASPSKFVLHFTRYYKTRGQLLRSNFTPTNSLLRSFSSCVPPTSMLHLLPCTSYNLYATSTTQPLTTY